MKIINIVPKSLYPWQKHIVKNLKDMNVVVAPRQHGKTYLMSILIQAYVYHPTEKYPEVLLISDTLERVFDLYKNEFDQLFGHNEFYSYPNKGIQRLRIKRPDGGFATIFLRGSAKTPKSAKGLSPNLIIMDEAGLCHPDTIMESCVPATDKSEGIIIVTGTVEDNWYHEFFMKAKKKVATGSKNWFYFSFKHGDKWSLGVHNKKRLSDIKDKYDFDMPDDKRRFDKEQMCNWFASSTDNIYRRLISEAYMQERVTVVPRLQSQKIGLTWDNGLGCTAIWFWQFAQGVVRLFKYQEWRSQSVFDISGDILSYLKEANTSIGCMVIPFTMFDKIQTEMGMPTIIEKYCQLLAYSGTILKVPKVANKTVKYEAMYHILQNAVFDEDNCSEGLRYISQYNISASRREMNKFSHASDSLSELAMIFNDNSLTPQILEGMESRPKIEEPFWLENERNKRRSVLGPY